MIANGTRRERGEHPAPPDACTGSARRWATALALAVAVGALPSLVQAAGPTNQDVIDVLSRGILNNRKLAVALFVALAAVVLIALAWKRRDEREAIRHLHRRLDRLESLLAGAAAPEAPAPARPVPAESVPADAPPVAVPAAESIADPEVAAMADLLASLGDLRERVAPAIALHREDCVRMAALIPGDYPWPDFPDPVAVNAKAARLERDIAKMTTDLTPVVAALAQEASAEPPTGGVFGAAGRFLGLSPRSRKDRTRRALRALWESLALLEKFFAFYGRQREKKGGLAGSWRVRRDLEDTIIELDGLMRPLEGAVERVGKEIPALASR